MLASILTHDPPPLSSVRPGVPAGVDRVVKKCLAKDPDERWQSAADLNAALQWSREDSASPHGPPDAIDKGRYFSRRVLAALLAGGGGRCAGGVDPARGRVTSGTGAAPPQFIPVTFRTGTVSAARFAPDGETIIYSAAWGGDKYALFMTRRGSPESLPLNIPDARLLGVSPAGDLAFLRGSHNALRLLAPPGTGTLTRVAMTGGGPREILDDVVAADWAPDGELAVVRRDRVEFPLGKTIHGPHQFNYVRVAPDGQRLALADGRDVVVLDRAGNKTTLSSGWGELLTIAWSPSGHEVWFAAEPRRNDGSPWTVRAVSLAGEERVVFYSAGTALAILDVFRDGRALVATHAGKMGCSCLPPGQMQPRELAWLDGSAPEALSADGRTVLLSELLSGAGKSGSTYVRQTDGADAIRLGEGYGEDLSPDGKWVLTTEVPTRQHWILLPTGAGSPRTLPPGPLVGRGEANFLPDGRRIVFRGNEKDRRSRIYLQDIESGEIRAISPEGVGTEALATPDGRYVFGWTGGRPFKYAVDEGAPMPLPFLNPGRQTRAVEPGWFRPLCMANRRVAAGSRSRQHGNRPTRAVEDHSARRPSGRRQHHQNPDHAGWPVVLPRLRAVPVKPVHRRRLEVSAVSFGDFVLDTDARELRRGGQPVLLTPKAYQLLEVLVRHSPKALSKSLLQEQLWPDTFVVEKNLVNLIAEIRETLGDDATHPRFVRTVHRFGYAFRDPAAEPPAKPRPLRGGTSASVSCGPAAASGWPTASTCWAAIPISSCFSIRRTSRGTMPGFASRVTKPRSRISTARTGRS